MVPAYANGQGPFAFLLDSGGSVSLLSPELAQNLGIGASATREAIGAGGKITLSLGMLRSLAVAGARVEELPVAITEELGRIAGVIGATVEGAIGYDFLQHFSLMVDYAAGFVRMTRPPLEASGEGGAAPPSSISFRLAHPQKPLILVSARVNEQGPYQFVLDTGASSTVIAPDAAQEAGIATVAAPLMTGGGGSIHTTAGTANSLAVGDARLERLSVMVADFLRPLGEAVSTRLDGVIGYNFLREFRMTINYPQRHLQLQRS